MNDTKQAEVTVVTPTYNRRYLLENCYISLIKQTNARFVWMIVDDGSTDNTHELVSQWILEGRITIEYYKKPNGGMASALNVALDIATTKYFVYLDSDDTLSERAIELALEQLQRIEKDETFAGLLALRTNPDGTVLGGRQIPEDIRRVNLPKLGELRIKSELIIFFKTEIINQFRFPEIPGEKFITPAYIEYKVGEKYDFLASRDIFCYCQYRDDGLTKNIRSVIKANPQGYTLVKRLSYASAKGIVPKSKHGIMYIAGCLLSGDESIVENSPNRLLTWMLYPFGWLACKIRFR